MWNFLIGLFIGANVGLIVACIICAAKHNEPFIYDELDHDLGQKHE